MSNLIVCIALTLGFIWIIRMTWKEWRSDRVREERRQYREWKAQDNLRWYEEQRADDLTEDAHRALIEAWKET